MLMGMAMWKSLYRQMKGEFLYQNMFLYRDPPCDFLCQVRLINVPALFIKRLHLDAFFNLTNFLPCLSFTHKSLVYKNVQTPDKKETKVILI